MNYLSKQWIIKIPNWQPTRLNVLMKAHYHQQSKLKNSDAWMIYAYSQDIPRAIKKRKVQIVIFLGKKQQGGDPDAYFKVTLDALVKLELLRDDNKEWVELLPTLYERSKDGFPATEIRLMEEQA